MKGKWQLFSSIFQMVVGIITIISFTIIGFGGENSAKWIGTLILAALFVVLGIMGIIDYKSKK